MIALTKTWHEADLADLPPTSIVDSFLGAASPQGGIRRWEYAMALTAMLAWERTAERIPGLILDVGGSGSPLGPMCGAITAAPFRVIDPAERAGERLDQYAGPGADVVFCISVVEHVEDLPAFLSDLGAIVAPDGLLFLTMDYWDAADDQPDTAHFHWMRRRIFTQSSWRGIHVPGCVLFGDVDEQYYGPFDTWGYSAASLALVKR